MLRRICSSIEKEIAHRLLLGACLLVSVILSTVPASAMQPIVIGPGQERIDITRFGDFYEGRGDRLDVETAAGPDGVAGRMSVRAQTSGTNPGWVVFAIRNPTDKPLERWLTADRYNVVGSGLIWPDLDQRRITNLTPSVGYVPERVEHDRVDIYRVTIEPGQMVTFVAELSSVRIPGIFLWTALAYEQNQRDRSLMNGIMLGVVGVLAMFLTSIFLANHKLIFPSAALVVWAVLSYLCIEFGYWHKLFHLKYAETAIYRATAESVVAASIVIFLYAYLKARFWHSFIRLLFLGWIGLQFAIVALAVIDPRLASMLARASLVLGAGVGTVTLVVLMLWGQDRAFALVPMWILYLVWLFGAGVVVGGRLSGDAVVMALNGGMVMLMLILAFTVTQFAFRGGDLLYGGSPSALQLRSLAIDNSASAVWEWNSRRDEIAVTRNLEEALGLAEGALSRSVDRFLDNVHAQDRDRLRLQLIAAREKNGGHIHAEFRMRAADGTYRWFELQAADVPSSDHRHLRYAGLVRDITDSKRSLERLVHDGVKDSLTGLPNRELFVDRLDVAIKLCRHEGRAAPVVLCIGIDRFGSVNREHGTMVGDTMLLTIGRRLERFVAPNDTVARIGGDEFAILISEVQDPAKIQHISDHIRRSMRAPLRLSGRDLVLSGAIGIAGYDGQQRDGAQLLREAESAMFKAKQRGPGQAEVFKADMRSEQDDRAAIESELRRALERRQVRVFYQPIIRQPDGVLAGFEALVRWHHPRLGVLNPDDFVPIAESSDLIVRLGSYVLERAVSDLARWQRELPRSESPLFVSVNISSRQLFRQDLVAELRRIVGRDETPRGTIVLEITESVLMENAEQAAEILKSLHGTGATLALDDFGTGFSALGYLHRYTFDLIKIDRSLLQAGSAEGSGRTIVNAIVALGHELGKKVIAEGVESDEDETFLRSVGCDMTQGFLYSDAISDSDVIELLRDLRRSERSERSWFRKRKASKSRPEDGAGVTTRPQEPPPAPPLPLAVVPPPPPPPMQAPPQPMTPPVAAFAPPDPSSRPPTAGARSLGQPPVRPGYQPNGPVAPPPPPTGVPHGYDAMPSAAAPPQAAPLPSGFPSVSPAQHGGAPGLSPSSAPGHGAPNGADWPPMPTRGPPPAQPAPSRALPPRWPDGPPQRSAGDEPVPEAPSQHATQRPPRKS